MQATSGYKVPATAVKVEEVIKNSQFITRIERVKTAEAAKAFIKDLNRQYPEATHHCWAYIVGNPKSTTLIGCSDDGEPSGTAGKPMLNVLQHADVGDIVTVCTRYYGGTKLGTGGLTRAYGGGVKLALSQLRLADKINYSALNFTLDYSQLKDCEHLIQDFIVQAVAMDYADKITVRLQVASHQRAAFKLSLNNQFKGKIEWKSTL